MTLVQQSRWRSFLPLSVSAGLMWEGKRESACARRKTQPFQDHTSREPLTRRSPDQRTNHRQSKGLFTQNTCFYSNVLLFHSGPIRNCQRRGKRCKLLFTVLSWHDKLFLFPLLHQDSKAHQETLEFCAALDAKMCSE